MRTFSASCGIAATLLVSACAYPTATIEQGDAASGIYFHGTPVGARVFIDGTDAGVAATFDGRKSILKVAPGRHQIAVRVSGDVLTDKPVYVGPGSRVLIEVP